MKRPNLKFSLGHTSCHEAKFQLFFYISITVGVSD